MEGFEFKWDERVDGNDLKIAKGWAKDWPHIFKKYEGSVINGVSFDGGKKYRVVTSRKDLFGRQVRRALRKGTCVLRSRQI